MQKKILVIAGISGAMSVALGAMGAHALREIIPAQNLQTLETAVRYQFYHTLALLLVALLMEKLRSKFLDYAAILFVVGIFLFSFSLYFLALRPLMGYNNEEMIGVGIITPFGGLSFILAWLMLSVSVIKSEK